MEKQPESPKRLKFSIKESVPVPRKIESGVPAPLTAELLQEFPATERAPFDSGKIEDFLISTLQEGLKISEIEERAKAKSLQDEIVQIQERVIPPEIQFALEHLTADAFVQKIKNGIAEEMRALGANEAQTDALAKVVVTFENEPGTSMAGPTSVGINIPQLLRKAYDCIEGLKMEMSELPQVVEILMTRILAHELGHTADQLMGMLSNKVERDERWGSPEQSEENKSERFAEFIATSQLDSNQAQLSHKERLLNVAKSAELWEAIHAYNEHHDQKVDLPELFTAIEKSFNVPSSKAFATSRRYLYSIARPENYAIPYTRDQIQRSSRVEEVV